MFSKEFPRHAGTATSGLVAGTLVESANGWMPVEDLRIGDAVHSYDGGLARVVGLDRHWNSAQAGSHLLQVPGGAFDNCSDLFLLPGQNMLIDTLNDASLPDDIVALVPAAALDGLLGTTRLRIDGRLEVITPHFADDEAIFANSGTLLHCQGIRQTIAQPASSFFRQLDLVQGQALLRRLYGASALHPLRRAA